VEATGGVCIVGFARLLVAEAEVVLQYCCSKKLRWGLMMAWRSVRVGHRLKEAVRGHWGFVRGGGLFAAVMTHLEYMLIGNDIALGKVQLASSQSVEVALDWVVADIDCSRRCVDLLQDIRDSQ